MTVMRHCAAPGVGVLAVSCPQAAVELSGHEQNLGMM